MTFEEVVKHAAANKELVAQYDRLSGTNLSLKGSPIDVQIDLATGRIESEVPDFVDFVYRAIWLPLVAQEAKDAEHP